MARVKLCKGTDGQCKDAEEPVLPSICLTLKPDGGCLITDSCSYSGPRGATKVRLAQIQGQEVIHRCPKISLFLDHHTLLSKKYLTMVFIVFKRTYDNADCDVLSESDQRRLSSSSSRCDLAGSSLSGMQFVALIEIAAFGSGPLNLSYIWHVSPVNQRATLHPPLPTVASNLVQLLAAVKSVCSTL